MQQIDPGAPLGARKWHVFPPDLPDETCVTRSCGEPRRRSIALPAMRSSPRALQACPVGLKRVDSVGGFACYALRRPDPVGDGDGRCWTTNVAASWENAMTPRGGKFENLHDAATQWASTVGFGEDWALLSEHAVSSRHHGGVWMSTVTECSGKNCGLVSRVKRGAGCLR